MSKILISLPDALKEQMDAYCKDKKYNRSEFIRFAIRKLIQPEKVETNDGTV